MQPKKITLATLHELIVTEIGDLVSIIQDVRTDLSARIDALDIKIDRVEERLDLKIDGVEERLSVKIDRVNENLSAKISGINSRMDDLANNHIRTEVHSALEKRVTTLERRWH